MVLSRCTRQKVLKILPVSPAYEDSKIDSTGRLCTFCNLTRPSGRMEDDRTALECFGVNCQSMTITGLSAWKVHRAVSSLGVTECSNGMWNFHASTGLIFSNFWSLTAIQISFGAHRALFVLCLSFLSPLSFLSC